MESRVNYALVGIFVLTLSAIAIAVLLWLAAGGPQHSYSRYLVLTNESVWALPPDAAVRYNGVKVGHVASIRLDRNNPQEVRIQLDIIDGTPITADTRATLQMQGITGIAFVSLSGGSPNAPPLTRPPGEPYPVIPNTPSLLQRLDVILTKVSSSLTDVSTRMGALLNDQNIAHLSAIAANLDTLTRSLADNSGRIDTTLQNFSTSSAKLPALLDNINQSTAQLSGLIANLNQSAQRFNTAADKVGSAAVAVQRALPQVDSAMQQMSDTANAYRHLGEELQRDPSALLYGPTPTKPGPGE